MLFTCAQMPKLKLLLGAALGRDWEEHEVLLPPEELTDAQTSRYRAYRRAVEKERCMDPLRVGIILNYLCYYLRQVGYTLMSVKMLYKAFGCRCICASSCIGCSLCVTVGFQGHDVANLLLLY
jgi:hypothetical protein